MSLISIGTFCRHLQLTALSATIAVAALTITPVDDAFASRFRSITYGTWKGGVYINDKTGEFSHCAVSAKYKSGITLFFSVTRSLKWQVGFAKPSWNLKIGNKYPIKYQVDRREVINGQARAATNKLAVIKLPGSSRLFNQMRRGKTLRVKAGKDLLAFNLTGTNNMLTRLLRCSKRNVNLYVDPPQRKAGLSGGSGSTNSANPFSSGNAQPKRKAPPRRSGITREMRQEAVEWFQNTLANSDVNYRVVKNEGSARKMYKKNAIIWRVGKRTGIIGTLRIFPRRTPEKLESSVLAYEARTCKGDFASRFLKDSDVGSREIRRLVTTCRENNGKQWNVYYAMADRPAGGAYLVSLLSSKAPADAVSQAGERVSGSMQMAAPSMSKSNDDEDDELPSRDDKVVNF